jgi:hypothetical protein
MSVMYLKGCPDEFTISKNPVKRVSMKEWNPMLISIAFKRVDIVRYLIQDLKVSYRLATMDPQVEPLPAQASISYQ